MLALSGSETWENRQPLNRLESGREKRIKLGDKEVVCTDVGIPIVTTARLSPWIKKEF